MNIIYVLKKNSSICRFLVYICLVTILANIAFAKTSDQKLSELRQKFAVNYLSPESHFALAQYYLEKGNKIQAFYILEYARRYRFSREEFDSSFVKYFGENSKRLSKEAEVHFNEAYCLVEEKKYEEAEKSLLVAANLDPKSAFIQSWIGRFYLKTEKDEAKALEHYFNAYFLDPNAYDTEYAEMRIRKYTNKLTDEEFEKLVKSGESLPHLVKHQNPLIVIRAIANMVEKWKPKYAQAIFDAMENDDTAVRWMAFLAVNRKSVMNSDELISKLLNDDDLRKKGLAAYAIAKRGNESDFKILKEMLNDKSDLIRFDSMSALALKGGKKGKEILIEHRKTEKHPYLINLIDRNLEEN